MQRSASIVRSCLKYERFEDDPNQPVNVIPGTSRRAVTVFSSVIQFVTLGLINGLWCPPRNVFQSFQECGLSEVVRSGSYSKFQFFQEVFFPNISSVASHLRDDLVLHILDAWSTEFDQLSKSVPCIPATPRGEILPLPGHLIHPEKEAASC